MKTILFITLLFFSYCQNLQAGEHHAYAHQHNSTGYKTYLVKTQLTKEQLETSFKAAINSFIFGDIPDKFLF